jgi:ferrous iron transport protein A
MMPLTFLNSGETGTIRRIAGKEEMRRCLENMGFVEGTPVEIISRQSGSVIVRIRGSRGAIAIILFLVYMQFFKPYHESEHLTEKVSVD